MAPEANTPGSGSKRDKPRYQAPVVLPLGGMAKGDAACSIGSSVTGQGIGLCRDGNGVRGLCQLGNGR